MRVIVRAARDGTLAFHQAAHARVLAPWVRAWRWEVPRREATAEAAARHDDGWIEWDEHPRIAGDGTPYSYHDVTDADYADIWDRGFALAWAKDAWTGLLVSRHGTPFLSRRGGEACGALAARETARQHAALRALGVAEAEAARASDLVAYLDGLSLFLCEEWRAPWTAKAPDGEGAVAITAERDGLERVTLDPWPFAVEHLRVEVPAVRVDATRWQTDADYWSDLDAGERVTFAWWLLPRNG